MRLTGRRVGLSPPQMVSFASKSQTAPPFPRTAIFSALTQPDIASRLIQRAMAQPRAAMLLTQRIYLTMLESRSFVPQTPPTFRWQRGSTPLARPRRRTRFTRKEQVTPHLLPSILTTLSSVILAAKVDR